MSTSGKLASVLVNVDQLRREVPGGIGTYAAGLVRGLLELERDERPALALFASRTSQRPDPLKCFGLPVVTSPLQSVLSTRLWELDLWHVKTDVSMVHATSFGSPSFSAPLVTTVHDLAWRETPESFPSHGRHWHERMLRRAAKRSVQFVVPSDAVKASLLESGLVDDTQRVRVIEEGADHLPAPDHLATQILLRSLGVHGEYLLTTGTLEPRKNLTRLVRAYGAVAKRFPEPWPLVVVGPKGWGSQRSEKVPGVHFAGRVSSAVLSGLYASARCCAYVPLVEGFGLPVVEAMVAGTPVVSSDVPAAGGASELVKATDVDSIAAGLLSAATDEERRAELRRAGARRVQSLTWSRTAKAHVELWREVVARGD